MASKWERDLTTIIASTVKVTQYNVDDQLPYQLVCPENDRITWTCGIDEVDKITSVFAFKGSADEDSDKKISYLENKERADHIRKELKNAGWIETKMPETTLSYPGMETLTVGKVELNRRQKRNFSKVMNAISNPNDHRARGKKALGIKDSGEKESGEKEG